MRVALVVGGLLVGLAGVVLDGSGAWGWAPGLVDGPVVTGALAALAVAGLSGLAVGVVPRRAAAVVALVAGAVLAVAGVRLIAAGLPGPSTGVLLVGVTATTLGTLVSAVTGPRRQVPRGRVRSGAATLVVVLAAFAAGALVDDLPVRRSTTELAVADAPVVTRPEVVRWTRPLDGPVADVVPIRGGVAVLRGPGPRGDTAGSDESTSVTGDEILALDGATGAPRWSYRRGEQRVRSVVATPDGTAVVVTYRAPGDAALVTVLDATSGRTRFSVAVPARRPSPHLTDRVLTVLDPLPPAAPRTSSSGDDDPTYRLVALRLDDGTPAWTWTPPPTCTVEPGWYPTLGPPGRETLVTRGAVVAWADCDVDRVLSGLDEETGVPRWSGPAGPLAVLAPDGGFETAPRPPDLTSLPDATGVLVGGGPARVVDAATGAARPVPALGEFDLGAVRPGPVRALRLDEGVPVGSVDAATGAVDPLPGESAGECATARGGVTVPTTGPTVRLCGVGPGFGVRVDAGPVLPLDLGAPALPAADRADDSLLYRRSEYVLVPAPGAFVVATTRTDPAVVVGLVPGSAA